MGTMKIFVLCLAISLAPIHAQSAAINPEYEGIWEGYNGEWEHVSRELTDLAQAIPADKYSWRPAPGVRSVSEVYMHIALSNFYLLEATGPKVPADMEADDMEKKVTSKAEVIEILKRSLAAVKTARAQLKPGELQRKVKIEGKTATVDGMYLRILIHDNEHMGQLIAYARVNAIAPPWSHN
jgi:uncharacterized damage-inducible protein DinB